MRLSNLQKYIILVTDGCKNTVKRRHFFTYYQQFKSTPVTAAQPGIITRSLERLIDKGLLIGYGRRTPQKWFIESVRLTAAGKRVAKKLHGEQQTLPFRFKKIKIK